MTTQHDASASAAAARLKAHLRAVGLAKAASHREVTELHLRMTPGQRLESAVAFCDAMAALTAATRSAPPAAASAADDEAEVWRRVHEHLARVERHRAR